MFNVTRPSTGSGHRILKQQVFCPLVHCTDRATLTMSSTQSFTTMPIEQRRERAQKDRGRPLASELQSLCSRDSSSGPILEPMLRSITLNTASPGVDVSSLCPGHTASFRPISPFLPGWRSQQTSSCWDMA